MTETVRAKTTAVRRIAVTEFRRTWRRLRTDGRRKFVGWIVMVGFYALFGGIGAYFLGRVLGSDGVSTMGAPRLGVLAVLAFGVFLVAQRTVNKTGSIDAPGAVLTATTPTVAALGLMGAEVLRALVFLGIPLSAVVIAFAAGVGDPTILVTVGATALAGLVGLIVTGFTIGMAIKRLSMRSRIVARHRGKLGALASFGAFGGYALVVGAQRLDRSVYEPLLALPPAWLADLALLPTAAVKPVSVPIVGSLGVVVVGVPLMGAAGVRLARGVWFGERVRPAQEYQTTAATGSRLLGLLPGDRLPVTTRQVLRKSWLRARRSPFLLQYAILPYFMVVAFGVQFSIQNGAIPDWLPEAVAAAGVVATGTAFTLNPIGDEENVVEVTLTSGVAPDEWFAGLVIAGWLVGLPLTVGATLLVGTALSADLVSTAVLATGSGLVAVGAPGIGLAAGIRFPSLETRSLPGDRTTVEPSSFAFGGVVLVLGIAGLPALLAVLFDVGRAITLAGFVGSAILTGIVGRYGFRDACRRFDGYLPVVES